MRSVRFDRLTVEITNGDIVEQNDCDAIVNAANAQLRTGGGVAGAIHSAGDPELEELTKPLAPIEPGEAVITEAPNMPFKYVIHCLGPVYGKDTPSDELLTNCYSNALKLADEHQVESIAFPSISTGAFGYPMKEAATVAFETIKKSAPNLRSVSYVRFVLWSPADYNLHWDVLKEM
ncbi:macro domain-containing protein [Rhodohalobacter mucosus]|uniref:RNase III inhibitor n=1 Tax=Rhodohalobacter mucosus TaxID=2079485 RepID=A0A316TWA9_9BACT|nr:macro domain-containing protein [Rhodohalobacter mucosus]PWN08141.1 RNase III inhibitor [Rhodohalobacter mucosus]